MTVFSIHDKLLGVFGTPQTVQTDEIAVLSVGKYIFEQSVDPATIEVVFYGAFTPEYGFTPHECCIIPVEGTTCLAKFQESYKRIHPAPDEEEGETK